MDSCTTLHERDHTIIRFAHQCSRISCLHCKSHSYLIVGAVFGKWLFSRAIRPLSTFVACSRARSVDFNCVRFLFHDLVTWWKCGMDRTNCSHISPYQILHTPLSVISKCWAAVWTQLWVLEERNKARTFSQTCLILYFETWRIKVTWDLWSCDLAEIRVAVATLVQQHFFLPLQESQRFIPGRYWSCPRAPVTVIKQGKVMFGRQCLSHHAAQCLQWRPLL